MSPPKRGGFFLHVSLKEPCFCGATRGLNDFALQIQSVRSKQFNNWKVPGGTHRIILSDPVSYLVNPVLGKGSPAFYFQDGFTKRSVLGASK